MSFTHTTPPCKGCENRRFKCHSECSEYIEWSKSQQEKKNEMRKVHYANNEVVDYKVTGARKRRKGYR